MCADQVMGWSGYQSTGADLSVPTSVAREIGDGGAIAIQRWGNLSLSDPLLVLALVLWAISVRGIRPELMNDYGLLPALPHTFFLSLLLLNVSFVWALKGA